MTARSSASGYGWVTRLLHWVTLVLLVVQFVLGYAMDELADWLLGEMDGLGRARRHFRQTPDTRPHLLTSA